MKIDRSRIDLNHKLVAGLEGVQGVYSNSPFELNYFMETFRKKNEAKLRKRAPLLNLNPLYRNPGSATLKDTLI